MALLPARGDPFTFLLFFHFFEKYWQGEVDRLLVLVNSTIEQEVVDFERYYVAKFPNVVFLHNDRPTDHGGGLGILFEQTAEDVVVFVEDDSLVLKKGAVDGFCRVVESNTWDVVGSAREMCEHELEAQLHVRFGLSEQTCFWPCFFFARRSDLLKTDRHFGARIFPAGEGVPQLGGWAPTVPQASDTFTWMSIQLRALGLRALLVPQYRGDEDLGSPDATWMHTGAPSALIETEIMDERNVPMIRRRVPGTVPLDEKQLHGGATEMERRFAWARLCYKAFGREMDPIADFRDAYRAGMARYIGRFGLDEGRINGLAEQYGRVIGLS